MAYTGIDKRGRVKIPPGILQRLGQMHDSTDAAEVLAYIRNHPRGIAYVHELSASRKEQLIKVLMDTVLGEVQDYYPIHHKIHKDPVY